MSLIIDAFEQRDVAIFDIPGAYLHADMKDFVLLKMVGPTVDIMIRVNAAWKQFVTHENGEKTLYLRLAKALYGCVQSGLLWYELYISVLKPLGFELNPYEPCVANATIEGTQCTMAWYCSTTCQKSDWKTHKKCCTRYKNRSPVQNASPQY